MTSRWSSRPTSLRKVAVTRSFGAWEMMSVPSSSALRLNLLSHVHPPSRSHRGYVSRSYDWRSPDAIASALIPASSALFADMMATCQPISGLGCTCTSCPSSARPSLIISAKSSAAILVFCMSSVPVFPTNYWASESFYKLHCYYFVISLDIFQRRLLWPHRRFSFSRRVLFESVARRYRNATRHGPRGRVDRGEYY